MSLLDNLAVSYRPVLATSTCATCDGIVCAYGAVVTVEPGAPLVGIDTSGMDLCHGHAVFTGLPKGLRTFA